MLVADDDPGIVEMLCALLKADPRFEPITQTAGCGYEAVGLVALEQPDAVILDLWMGPLGGRGAARLIRSMSTKIVLVAFSGYLGDQFRHHALDAGFDDLVEKGTPNAHDRLLNAIHQNVIARRNSKH